MIDGVIIMAIFLIDICTHGDQVVKCSLVVFGDSLRKWCLIVVLFCRAELCAASIAGSASLEHLKINIVSVDCV